MEVYINVANHTVVFSILRVISEEIPVSLDGIWVLDDLNLGVETGKSLFGRELRSVAEGSGEDLCLDNASSFLCKRFVDRGLCQTEREVAIAQCQETCEFW